MRTDGLGYIKNPDLAPNLSVISVFHQLHCLQYTLRRAYYSTSEPGELEDFDFGLDRTSHTSHCFEYLRQSLMCSADPSIEPADTRVDGFLGWGFQRQCRNFVELKGWAENSRAFEGHGFLAADIVQNHRSQAHYTATFLSWHRWFIHIYENALRQQCGYSGYLTYWDWSLDWENITLAPVFDNELGFGGNGNTSDKSGFRGSCVTDGPFARLEVLFAGPIKAPHCLTRNFANSENLTKHAQPIRPAALAEVLRAPRYEEFNTALESGPHLSMPLSINGDFSAVSAPQDPLFFLHHTQLDRQWWKWQQADREKRLRDYSGRAVFNSTERAAGLEDLLFYGDLGPTVRVLDIMDTTTGPLCYAY
ncbi:MAG: hypothetical protein ASARMPREDX12_009559 [Alectoria sarmentosa]|nr:MAG: hypothetical protein ASARMPREDX12_009559 [Alectoria sarmentosa]